MIASEEKETTRLMMRLRWSRMGARLSGRAPALFSRYITFLAALAVALVAFVAFARVAHADTATAQALFDDAKKLMAAGKYAEACPKLEESQRLDPGLGTQFNLATCYESLGKTASAWSTFLDVAGGAKAANQADREKVARQRAAVLEKSLSRLTITVSNPIEGIEVRRDGAVVGQAQLGTAVPIDPGSHKVEAWAPGKKPWQTTIEVGKEASTQKVEVPALEDGGPMPPPGAYPPGYPPPPPADTKPKMKRRSGGMMAGGIVALSLGTLGTLGGLAAMALCSDALDCNIGGPVVFTVVSGLVLAGGITLTVVGGKKVPVNEPPKTSKTTAVPVVTIGPGSAALRWAF
jgi:hypothetical protein